MLYYYTCTLCKTSSDLFFAEEDVGPPKCMTCGEAKGFGKVEKRSTNVYFITCRACAITSNIFSVDDYSGVKGTRPTCPKCNLSDTVCFLPPNVEKEKLKRRKTVGVMPREERKAIDAYERFKPEKTLVEEKDNVGKRKIDELHTLEDTITGMKMVVGDAETNTLAKAERKYRSTKKIRKDFDTAHGKLEDTSNPLKTSEHVGREVPLSTYEAMTAKRETVYGRSYPRVGASMPTVVNSAFVVSRDFRWDYRELGPNSLLRKLCTLIYIVSYGAEAGKNPVEVQAMWAAGSLFIATNNYTFTEMFKASVVSNTHLDGTLRQLKIPVSTDSSIAGINTTKRNFSSEHVNALSDYRLELTKQKALKDYFQYKWAHFVDPVMASMKFSGAKLKLLTIAKNDGDYTAWTSPLPAKDCVYFVVPETGTGFLKKKIHAEQMFYPILSTLDVNNKLSVDEPAFIGGVKTPCRTCAEVLIAAGKNLGEKLILPTDAFGHYWEGSGMHVPDPDFEDDALTMVFGVDTTSDSIYDTEMPRSPEHH